MTTIRTGIRDVLRRLAQATGGEAFFPGELSEVVAICERIARDIRNQYTIGYVSTQPGEAGAYRAIRVVAQRGGQRQARRAHSRRIHRRAGSQGGGAK